MLEATNGNSQLPGGIMQACIGPRIDERVSHLTGQRLRCDETREITSRGEHGLLHSEKPREFRLKSLVDLVVTRRPARRRHIEAMSRESRGDCGVQGSVAGKPQIVTPAKIGQPPTLPKDAGVIDKMHRLRQDRPIRLASF
jgi:hypothetical protein